MTAPMTSREELACDLDDRAKAHEHVYRIGGGETYLSDAKLMRDAAEALRSIAQQLPEPRISERLADVVMMLDTPDAYNRGYITAVCRSILSSVSSTDCRYRADELPRCEHGNCLMDGAGETLEPPCGCRCAVSQQERQP